MYADPSNADLVAQDAYQRAYRKGQRALLWSTLTRRSRHLLDLAQVEPARSTGDGRKAGMQRVPIRQIRGGWGRSADFDADFLPLKLHD
jgi:hypothetical protein